MAEENTDKQKTMAERLQKAVDEIEELFKDAEPDAMPSGSLELGNDIVEGMKSLLETFGPEYFDRTKKKEEEPAGDDKQSSLTPAQRLFG